MATLYVRNVPASLHAKLRELAAEEGRSLNRAILRVLEEEVERREERAEFDRRLAELNEKNRALIGSWEDCDRRAT